MARTWNPAHHPRDKRGRFTRSATKVMTAADRKRGAKALEGVQPRVFGDRAEARDYLAGLNTEPAGDVVRRYLDSDWRQTNTALRAGKKPDGVDELDQAMTPLPDDLLLRRQVPLSLFADVPMDELEGMKVRDAAYASTSLDLGPSSGPPDAVTMHILAPAETKAYVNVPDGEILLGRDTEVAISRVERNDYGGWDVYGIVLPKAATRQGRKTPSTKGTDPKPQAATQPARSALDAAPLGLGRDSGSLNADQSAALVDYQSTYYQSINGQLRRGDISASVQQRVDQIDAVMAASKLTGEVEVWRGRRNAAVLFGDRIEGDLTGVRWREDAYVSTSADEHQARNFATDGAGANPLLMRIKAPKGVGAVEISPMGDQAELLLDRGHEFEVTTDAGIVNGVRRLDVAVRDKTGTDPLADTPQVEPSAAWQTARSGEQVFDATTRIQQAAGRLVVQRRIRQREMNRVQQAAVSYGSDPRAGDLNYVTINAAVRGHGGQVAPDAADDIRRTINDLDLLLTGAPLPTTAITWRGLQSPASAFPGWRDDGDNTGLEWTAEGYQSTTTDENIAYRFASGTEAGGVRTSTPTVARVLIPKSTPGLAMSPVVSEILLPRNQRFRLVADNGVVEGVRRVDIEVIAGGGGG